MKTKLFAVAGPTASGKTALAVLLAERVGGEVISNDSMQIYKGMEIGTAAPSTEEMRGIAHHMIGTVDPSAEFSCADYASAARALIDEISGRGKVPVFCGGTGLYLDSVLTVDNFSASVKNDELRCSLEAFAQSHGAEALHKRLADIDPEAAQAIHANNVRRVIRAIEIYETTGITKTEWDARSAYAESPYDACIIVLDFLSRELLYSRIERRVDLMMSAGLEDEVYRLWRAGLLDEKKPAYQAIGYKEFIPYFKGECALADTVAAIKQNTRRYAKRQQTWFRRYPDALRVFADTESGEMRPTEDICDEIMSCIENKDQGTF